MHGRDDDGALVAAEDKPAVVEGGGSLPLVFPLQTFHVVDVDDGCALQAGQPAVGTHPQMVVTVPNERRHHIGGQPLSRCRVAHPPAAQVVVIDASAVGGYPQPAVSVEGHGVDEVVVVYAAELFGIEEAGDPRGGGIDEIGTMSGPHCHGSMVGRLYDTLHLLDGVFPTTRRRDTDQRAVETPDPHVAMTVGQQTVDIVGTQIAQRGGIGQPTASVGLHGIDAVAVGGGIQSAV